MASDLISREWIEDELQEEIEWGKENNLAGYVSALRLIKRRLKSAPAVDAVKVVRCEDCAHRKREGNALRCPYSTVDLDQKGYCSRGIPIAMAAKAPLDEHVKKAITEGEWGDQV